jgi:hypothetical protein
MTTKWGIGSRIRDRVGVGLLFVLTLPCVIASQPAQRFTAFAVNMTNRNTGASARMEIVINRWSTEAEREALAIADEESGMQAVVDRLQKGTRIGYIRIGSRLGEDVTFAREVLRSDGSRRIEIVMARSLAPREIVSASPTADYPFTVVELHVNANGAGEGTMSVGVRVKVHKRDDQIEVNRFAAGTVRLNDLKLVASQ